MAPSVEPAVGWSSSGERVITIHSNKICSRIVTNSARLRVSTRGNSRVSSNQRAAALLPAENDGGINEVIKMDLGDRSHMVPYNSGD